MRHRALLVFMLLALLWQSAALGRVGSAVNAWADLEHAALHWLDAAHHHHEDGSYHADETGTGQHHVLTDHFGHAGAPTATGTAGLRPPGSAALPGMAARQVPEPLLDGLLRPPRAPA